MSQSVNWVFTINNPDDLEEPKSWALVKYCVWQLESGENGTRHLQGYVVMNRRLTLIGMKRLNATAHWEIRRGNHKQAKAYCMKPETRIEGPWEHGEEPCMGKRSDLEEVFEMVQKGSTPREIAETMPTTFMRYHKGIMSLRFALSKPRNFKTEVTVIWGDTGVGKSRWAMETYGETAYWKPPNSKWWDGYDAQEVVIVDEYYAWLSWTEILRLCDRYPCSVETKGSSVQFTAKKLIFLSNQHPIQWYTNPKCHYPVLSRRFERLAEMKYGGLLDVEIGSFE